MYFVPGVFDFEAKKVAAGLHHRARGTVPLNARTTDSTRMCITLLMRTRQCKIPDPSMSCI